MCISNRYVCDPEYGWWMLNMHYLLIQGVAYVFADRYVWDPVDAGHALLSHRPPPAAPHRGGQQQPSGQHGLQRLTVCALDHSFYQACLLVSLPLGGGRGEGESVWGWGDWRMSGGMIVKKCVCM